MGIFQGDVIIKTMIDLSLDEMKKNPWLLDHAFESLKTNRYIADKYGQANIDAAKEWFANNRIGVFMRPRNDKDQTPMVTILPGSSNEKSDMKHLGDLSAEKIVLLPNEIGKPIPFIVKPFTPKSYDMDNGLVHVDINTPGLDGVVAGQVLVDPNVGEGMIIQGVVAVDENTLALQIEAGLHIGTSEFAVVPQYAFYEARIEHTFNHETYSIGCYSHGDPQNLIFLHTIVLYAILRYRQTLLEGNGFAESVINSGEIGEDPNFTGPGGEECFVRFIAISGQTENSWIKAPQRIIESIVIKDREAHTGGIKILTNEMTPSIINPQTENWYAIEDEDET